MPCNDWVGMEHYLAVPRNPALCHVEESNNCYQLVRSASYASSASVPTGALCCQSQLPFPFSIFEHRNDCAGDMNVYREVQHVSITITLDLFLFPLTGALKESLHIRYVLKICLTYGLKSRHQIYSNIKCFRSTLQGNASECFVSQDHCFDTSFHNS